MAVQTLAAVQHALQPGKMEVGVQRALVCSKAPLTAPDSHSKYICKQVGVAHHMHPEVELERSSIVICIEIAPAPVGASEDTVAQLVERLTCRRAFQRLQYTATLPKD
jgi:hypothetical protein